MNFCCSRFLSGMVSLLIALFTLLVPLTALLYMLAKFYVQNRSPHRYRGASSANPRPIIVGFFHPYCNAGGGGERVLWTAIRAIQKRYPDARCVVYTGDVDATPDQIVQRVATRFNISLPRPVDFVFLTKRKWVEAGMYPYLTLLGQSLGSMYLGMEAVLKLLPDVYVDSMGYAFTLPLFKYLGGCRVACYVHYPTISTDMLDRVGHRLEAHNNRRFISNSAFLTTLKLWYYRIFAGLYGAAGRCADVVMVNSSWTKGHLNSLWNRPSSTFLVYPPCDTAALQQIPVNEERDQKKWTKKILSVAQFRPEKDHRLQIAATSRLLQRLPAELRGRTRLVLVGSCRNAEDAHRVEELRKLCRQLDVAANVDFELNVTFGELKQQLEESTIGIHTMWNEHFGIGVVECMAAGVVMVAHGSGGPQMDIVVEHEGNITGFLATDADEYAEAMRRILLMPSAERVKIALNARSLVARFADDRFEASFLDATQRLFSNRMQ